ncbi:MAG: DUF2642 domain-containing protein, partial [Clostridia bacterium]
MMNVMEYMGKTVEVELSGKTVVKGTLIDVGADLIVLYSAPRYFYIPNLHIQMMKEAEQPLVTGPEPITATPIAAEDATLSFRKILDHARGCFVEIYVSGNKTIHGYVTSLMNDYFFFYSPAYKSMYVSLQHVKWVVPYDQSTTPYSLSNQHFPVNPATAPLSRTFEQQCKKLEGQLVVFDLGDRPD